MSTISIRRRLLMFLLPPLAALTLAGIATASWTTHRVAERVFDQRLADAARLIAGGIRITDGRAQVALPEGGSDLHITVTAPSGQVLASSGVSGPAERSAAYVRQTSAGPIRVVVGGTLDTGSGALQVILGSSWLVGFVQLDITLLLIWLGVHYGLKPLTALRDQIAARSPRDLQPLSAARVPSEARPLVDTLNLLFDMLSEAARSQRQFVADTAHQLRTPLAGLLGHLELLIQAPEGAAVRERLEVLRTGLTRLAHSANQLLGLARADPASHRDRPFTDVDLEALVTHVVEINVTRAAGLDIDLGAELRPAHVAGDAHLLADLLGNLVDNALKYTGAGGHVTVSCGLRDGAAFLQVEDDGPGIPESERWRVRQRFYRLPDSGGTGCGLGLAIVDEIARLHDADLGIEAGAAGRGTCIRLAFRPPGK